MSPWRQRVAPLSICHNSVNGNVNVTVSQLLVVHSCQKAQFTHELVK
jgi:hypothetical protein